MLSSACAEIFHCLPPEKPVVCVLGADSSTCSGSHAFRWIFYSIQNFQPIFFSFMFHPSWRLKIANRVSIPFFFLPLFVGVFFFLIISFILRQSLCCKKINVSSDKELCLGLKPTGTVAQMNATFMCPATVNPASAPWLPISPPVSQTLILRDKYPRASFCN